MNFFHFVHFFFLSFTLCFRLFCYFNLSYDNPMQERVKFYITISVIYYSCSYYHCIAVRQFHISPMINNTLQAARNRWPGQGGTWSPFAPLKLHWPDQIILKCFRIRSKIRNYSSRLTPTAKILSSRPLPSQKAAAKKFKSGHATASSTCVIYSYCCYCCCCCCCRCRCYCYYCCCYCSCCCHCYCYYCCFYYCYCCCCRSCCCCCCSSCYSSCCLV